MNKIVVLLILLLTVAITSIVLVNKNKKTPWLETAKKSSAAGDMRQAFEQYAEAAFELVPSQPFPDVNRLQFLPNDALKTEVMKYMEWLGSPSVRDEPQAAEAVNGVVRLLEFDKKENFPFGMKVAGFTPQKYLAAWNTAFSRSGSVSDPAYKPLAEGNFARNMSIVSIRCEDNYSYELSLVNMGTLKSTTCHLPSQNSVNLFALPGKHLLLVRSTVSFSKNDTWRSSATALLLDIPENASSVSFELRTSVKRKR